MQEAIEQGDRGCLDWQEAAPILERPVAGHTQAAAFVGGGHETKQQLAAGVVEWSEAELVDQNQLVPQQAANDLADGVIGQAAIQRFDQVRGNDIADLHPTLVARQLDRLWHTNSAAGWVNWQPSRDASVGPGSHG